MITPEPPAGSEHYREGWRHGYEHAAIDRERSADAVRLVPEADRCDAVTTGIGGAPIGPCIRTGAHTVHEDRHGCTWWLTEPGSVPDTGQVCTLCTSRGAPVCCCERPADLAYARSEVDKWLADNDPYCILPTRTEHIPALLARLDELEGTR